jgi:hypothetical protein
MYVFCATFAEGEGSDKKRSLFHIVDVKKAIEEDNRRCERGGGAIEDF